MPKPTTEIVEAAALPAFVSPTVEAPVEVFPAQEVTPKHFQLLTDDEWAQIECSAYQFGTAPESYDIACSTGSILRTPCGEGFLNVYPDRSFWHVPGGLIADDDKKPSTVRWLKQLATQQRRTVAVYSVSSEEASLFRDAGYQVNKFGEEALIDLGTVDWQGKSFEWVRRQTNYCRRQGLDVVEITSSEEQQQLANELTDVFYDDLEDRVFTKPLRLLEGQFNPRALGRRRLFVARCGATGRTEGFLVISPMENGTAWAFETYRKRRDAVRGTIPYLFREVTDRLQSQGVRRVSLCLVPGKGVCADHSPETDAQLRFVLSMWYGKLNFLFSTAGQDYFKSRFRPRYVDRYVCVYPRNTWLSFISFLRIAGALQFNSRNLFRQLVGLLRQPFQRKG